MEFYPEEGKYHYTGHRKCGVRQSPGDTLDQSSRCPVCRRTLTLGVLHRVQSMSNGEAKASYGTDGFLRDGNRRPPFIRLLPLVEIIAQILGQGPSTKKVEAAYRRLTGELGSELQVLMDASLDELKLVAGEKLARAVLAARVGGRSCGAGIRRSLRKNPPSPGTRIPLIQRWFVGPTSCNSVRREWARI